MKNFNNEIRKKLKFCKPSLLGSGFNFLTILKVWLLGVLLVLGNALIAQAKTINVNQQAGETITFDHHQNDLTLEYVGIHFDNPEKIQYQYKMEGVHDDWVKVGTERIARFNNLKPGHYTFLVKAANADGVWTKEPTSLNITILAPWYWTWWSKLLYLSIALFGAYKFYEFQLKRKLETAEKKRLQELDLVKTKMYTNITHEFRTPLSIIQGMTEQLEGNDKVKDTIQRNSFNLLNLVNQMLDLSKLESGNLPIKMVQSDVVNYLSYLTESFHSMAISKGIKLHFLPKESVIYMDYDPDKLMKIMINLLSNAIKFTDKGGDVYVEVATQKINKTTTLQIQIRDTGIGIAKDDLANIFDRFYQVDDSTTRKGEGTGIGLAYTRELVKILNGSIDVNSKEGKGSVFSVSLPITKNAPMIFPDATKELIGQVDMQLESTEKLADDLVPQSKKPLALIVEDNRDVKEYLVTCLKQAYQLVLAENGTEGIKKAIELIPDIIISDVMMPEKDGFELCQTLKEEQVTSHIPIILLTAKADIDSRLVGLQKGADAYMAKPFNREELLIRINQLILIRKQLQERFGVPTNINLPKEKRKYHAAKFAKEEDFIHQINQIIEQHLDEDTFDTAVLAQKMNMSTSQLYRKLKAITGKSTAIYIRFVRLKKSKILISETEQSISEIAYAVGFKDLAYFSRCFSELFGVSPSQLRK